MPQLHLPTCFSLFLRSAGSALIDTEESESLYPPPRHVLACLVRCRRLGKINKINSPGWVSLFGTKIGLIVYFPTPRRGLLWMSAVLPGLFEEKTTITRKSRQHWPHLIDIFKSCSEIPEWKGCWEMIGEELVEEGRRRRTCNINKIKQ